MNNKQLALIIIAIIAGCCIIAGAVIYSNHSEPANTTITNNTTNITENITNITEDVAEESQQTTNSKSSSSASQQSSSKSSSGVAYDPQSDSYVSVVGEGYDSESGKSYTYDSSGYRYYGTHME